MIIVSGRLFVKPSQRRKLLALSRSAVIMARSAPGCMDFVVAADPLDRDRVNVYEQWQSEAELDAFRGAGPSSAIASLIARAEVARHYIACSTPA